MLRAKVIIYAVLAPLILPLACVAFSLFWLLYRYLLLYMSQTDVETDGRTYPTALFQLMTGVYTCELCLLGLLFLQGSGTRQPMYFAQAATMAAIFLLTCAAHQVIRSWYGPLLELTDFRLETPSDAQETHPLQNPVLEEKSLIVWIPRDKLGFSSAIKDATHDMVEITDEGASLGSNGRIEIQTT
jgi:calcium permeable stress-gated cation channel